jgi:hypothetical protein
MGQRDRSTQGHVKLTHELAAHCRWNLKDDVRYIENRENGIVIIVLEIKIFLKFSETCVAWIVVSGLSVIVVQRTTYQMFVLSMKHNKYNSVTMGTTKQSIFVRNLLSALRAATVTYVTWREISSFSAISMESFESIAIVFLYVESGELGPECVRRSGVRQHRYRALLYHRSSLEAYPSTGFAERTAGFSTLAFPSPLKEPTPVFPPPFPRKSFAK